MSTSTPTTNRLADSQSPYLLQHAENPVNWYPWGPEAFAAAKRDNKPIFLSIGYATCHWCHVMAHESFENEEVANLLNENFIAIKVDREERPDIDNIYMAICQMLTGHGGWPLTIVMTPDKQPFFAGTYIPRESRYGRMGMLELLPRLWKLWSDEPDRIATTTAAIMQALEQAQQLTVGDDLSRADLDFATAHLRDRYDPVHGGFGSKPKFPSPHNLIFLLRQYDRTGDATLLDMVEATLTAMRKGGIFDHVGFGFHRYSTDEHWLLPHFEKMLYDQAMLMMAYAEAYQATGNPLLGQTAEEIAAYLFRDMTSPEGAFFSAEDADSEGEEGKFYFWSTDEVTAVLPAKDARWVIDRFKLERDGNFQDEATGQPAGTNIFHLAEELTVAEAEKWRPLRERLLKHREGRIRPQLDDKILTDWNGLMIAALAQAGQITRRQDFVEAAEKAANFLLKTLKEEDGRLLHRYRNGEAGIRGNLDDYAFLVWGLINLYEATFKTAYLATAIEITDTMLQHFWDPIKGGLFFTPGDGEDLLVRRKEHYDGAIPSGNSVAAMNLVRLSRMTGNTLYEERAAELGRAFASLVAQVPSSLTYLLAATSFALGPSYEVVIAGDPSAQDTQQMLAALGRGYRPHKVVILRPGKGAHAITELAPYTLSQTSLNGSATAYVCQDHVCDAPTTAIDAMLEALGMAIAATE